MRKTSSLQHMIQYLMKLRLQNRQRQRLKSLLRLKEQNRMKLRFHFQVLVSMMLKRPKRLNLALRELIGYSFSSLMTTTLLTNLVTDQFQFRQILRCLKPSQTISPKLLRLIWIKLNWGKWTSVALKNLSIGSLIESLTKPWSASAQVRNWLLLRIPISSILNSTQ